jgi:hypothetical protein
MIGPGAWPQKVEIAGNIAFSASPNMTHFNDPLLPLMNTDQAQLNAAYAESYMVLQIAEDLSSCAAGWSGHVDGGGNMDYVGSSYQTSGVAIPAAQLASIVTVDPTNTDYTDVNVPHFQTTASERPVMVQFVGEFDHYGSAAKPPLAEYHPHIQKVFYDTQVQALVLQFIDLSPSLQPSQVVKFNHDGRKKRHTGVVIRPQ